MIRRRLRLPTLALAPLAAVALATVALLTVAAVPAAAQSACGAYYTVRTGDSLVEVAERCGVTVPALLAANPGVADLRDLEVGGRLAVPDPGAPQPAPMDACGAYYTVRTGDTVAEIAEKCGLPIPLLVAANGPLPDPLGIHDGMKIRIPPLPREAVDDPMTVAGAARAGRPVAEGAAEAGADVGAAEADAAGGRGVGEPESGGAADLTRVEGVLEQGPRCLAVRPAGGEPVAIAGDTDVSIPAGTEVVLLGIATDDSACEVEPALELRILYRQRR